MPATTWRRRFLARLTGLVGATALAGGWNGLGLFGGLWRLGLVLLGGCGTLCLGDGSGLDKPAGSSAPEPHAP